MGSSPSTLRAAHHLNSRRGRKAGQEASPETFPASDSTSSPPSPPSPSASSPSSSSPFQPNKTKSKSKSKHKSDKKTECKPPRPEDIAAAMAFKEIGNEHFKAGEYAEADKLYSQAIQRNPSDPKLFSNRALSRIKLQDWAGAELDARKAIELYGPKNPSSMKPYYYLAQALLGLQHPVEALETAKYAYKICLEIRDSSSEVLSQFILRTRQAQWQRKETARLRELNQTLAEVEDLFQGQLDRELQSLKEKHAQGGIGEVGMQEEQKELEREAQAKQTTVREAFRNAQTEEAAERIVPDYLIDGITFEIMQDPVITPSGVSYERSSILKHLKASPFDPLTRESLSERQLTSNVALKNAAAEFMDKNGWAIDY